MVAVLCRLSFQTFESGFPPLWRFQTPRPSVFPGWGTLQHFFLPFAVAELPHLVIRPSIGAGASRAARIRRDATATGASQVQPEGPRRSRSPGPRVGRKLRSCPTWSAGPAPGPGPPGRRGSAGRPRPRAQAGCRRKARGGSAHQGLARGHANWKGRYALFALVIRTSAKRASVQPTP